MRVDTSDIANGLAAIVCMIAAITHFTTSNNSAGIGWSVAAFWSALHTTYVWADKNKDSKTTEGDENSG